MSNMMTKEQKINDGNILIAEEIMNTRYLCLHPITIEKIKSQEIPDIDAERMNYHIFWDSLIPVVEKLESLHYWVTICLNECFISDMNKSDFPEIVAITKDEADTKIEAVWKACVEAAKYIKQNKN